MTDLLQSLFKRIQDGASELGEAMLGDRIERSLDQDIRDIDLHLHQARNAAAATKALRVDKEDEVKRSKAGIAAIEAEIADLLSRRRMGNARTRAARAVALQDEHAVLQRECKELKDKEAEYARLIAQLDHKLRRAKHQLGTLRAASGIQRAQAAVARLQPGPSPYPESAQASAQRARQRAADGGAGVGANAAKLRGRQGTAKPDADVALEALIGRLSARTPAAATKRTTRKPR
jgi:phage shock protein A